MGETNTILMVVFTIALVAVVVVLFAGIFSMAIGGKFNERYGNKLMRLRVLFQLIAVLLLGAMMLISMN